VIAWEDVTARDFLPGGRYFAGLLDDDPRLARGIPYPDHTGRTWFPDVKHPEEPPPWSERWRTWAAVVCGLSGVLDAETLAALREDHRRGSLVV
jgi:hypothetical protein